MTHWPSLQYSWPGAQALPQLPQLLGSVRIERQVPLQQPKGHSSEPQTGQGSSALQDMPAPPEDVPVVPVDAPVVPAVVPGYSQRPAELHVNAPQQNTGAPKQLDP
jgi:hypothetical protein